ncbi:hypothetical protein CEXT_55231 [Caerostris extrusa]|uniref:Transmembrane protein n=1 Tax=Caerostris extrusa TaxID=172846 RepID=A0AAV4QBG9_CAEEX|nr:hypothetical protein CEXT_55231 [Caerostris extrusa]
MPHCQKQRALKRKRQLQNSEDSVFSHFKPRGRKKIIGVELLIRFRLMKVTVCQELFIFRQFRFYRLLSFFFFFLVSGMDGRSRFREHPREGSLCDDYQYLRPRCKAEVGREDVQTRLKKVGEKFGCRTGRGVL